MLLDLPADLITSILSEYLSCTDVQSVYRSCRDVYRLVGDPGRYLSSAYINTYILTYARYRYRQYHGDRIPGRYRPYVLLALLRSYQVDGTDGLSLAYCVRHSLYSIWYQLIQHGARYSQSRHQIKNIITEQIANRILIQDPQRFHQLIHNDEVDEITWHRAIIDLIQLKFQWQSTLFYDGNLDHATQYERDCRHQLLQFILEHGADPNLQANTGDLAPLMAISCGTYSGRDHGDIQRDLLEHGYEVDEICRSTGMTSLQIAAGRAHCHILPDLLDAGADPNSIGATSGLTPLHHIANCMLDHAGHALHLLVNAGANPNAIDHDGLTAMHFAATRDNVNVVDALLDHGAAMYPITGSTNPWSPAFFAIINHGNRVLRLLLDRGYQARHTGPGRRSLLHAAVECQNQEAMVMLLNAKADVNAADEYGMSPLGSGIYTNNVEAVRLLVDSGADITGDILHTAARLSNSSMMWILVRSCRDPDLSDLMGKTALMSAARFGNQHTCKVLVEAGAVDINKYDRAGFTALFYARAYGNHEVELILLAAGATQERIKSRLGPFCGPSSTRPRSAVY